MQTILNKAVQNVTFTRMVYQQEKARYNRCMGYWPVFWQLYDIKCYKKHGYINRVRISNKVTITKQELDVDTSCQGTIHAHLCLPLNERPCPTVIELRLELHAVRTINLFQNKSTGFIQSYYVNSLQSKRFGSPSAQVLTCCLTVRSHYLNQLWLIISKV